VDFLLKSSYSAFRNIRTVVGFPNKKYMESNTHVTKISGANGVEKIRTQFPMLGKRINRKPFIYFDNAATCHKPQVVLNSLQKFYSAEYGKPNEEHPLSKETTSRIEDARKAVANFIGAPSEKNIVFTRGCTESLNIVSGGFARGILKKGDEVVITSLEHHANIVPWQMACELSGAILKIVPLIGTGEVDIKAYKSMLSDKTKIVAMVHASHVLGSILPVKQMIKWAHERKIPVMLDGAQAVPHMPVNMQELDCDFYTFSAHKMGGPTGLGVLYGKKKWLEQIPSFEGGSDMVKKVTFEKYEYADVPQKFEAGTMPFAEIIAFETLIGFLEKVNMEKVFRYEQELARYTEKEFNQIEGLFMMGSSADKVAVMSFHIGDNDVKLLEKYLNDRHNIFVRAGDLSAQPLIKLLRVKGLLRVSFSFYNTKEEVDALVKALKTYLRNK
jgi:cysteine desulfurase / selenocysteine lyase